MIDLQKILPNHSFNADEVVSLVAQSVAEVYRDRVGQPHSNDIEVVAMFINLISSAIGFGSEEFRVVLTTELQKRILEFNDWNRKLSKSN